MHHLPLIISDLQSFRSLNTDSCFVSVYPYPQHEICFLFLLLGKSPFITCCQRCSAWPGFFLLMFTFSQALRENFGFYFLWGLSKKRHMPATSSCHFFWGFNFSSVHLFVKHHWVRAWEDHNVLEGVWEHRHNFSRTSDPTRIQPCCPMIGGRKQQGVGGKQ